MAFDGIFLHAAAAEVRAAALDARVEKIHQPDPRVITLRLYGDGETHTLLISCDPRFARLHLTGIPRENPPSPPVFCQLLRSRLEGGRMTAVAQEGLERILRLTVERRAPEGEIDRHVLVAELTGKHSNLILLNGEEVIVDALRRVPARLSRHREVLPGRPYLAPPRRHHLALASFREDGETACGVLRRHWTGEEETAWRALMEIVDGVGPAHARHLIRQAGIVPDTPAAGVMSRLDMLCSRLEEAAVNLASGRLTYARAANGFTALPDPDAPAGARSYPSAGALLDAVFSASEEEERLRQEHQRLVQAVAAQIQRARTRLAAQEEEYRQAAGAQEHRIAGELLKANLPLLRPGLEEVTVTDWFDPAQGERTIRLDPRLSPAANVQACFKRYTKGKRAISIVEEKLTRTRDEISYLEGVEACLDMAAGADELADVAAELAESSYLKDTTKGKRDGREKKKADRGKGAAQAGDKGRPDARPAGRPLRFVSADGYVIMVGKNNRQNDHLTMREAAPGDLWLHAKDIPGSHVIVRLTSGVIPGHSPAGVPAERLEDIPPPTLQEAAVLAAHFSKARLSGNVPVDYTFRRHVRKPRGARPGGVIYTDNRTLFVTPDPETVSRLGTPGNAPPSS